MQDETAKDKGQTAAGIGHDLIRNIEMAFSYTRNLVLFMGLWERLGLSNISDP